MEYVMINDERVQRDKDVVQIKPHALSNSQADNPVPIAMIAVVAADGAIGCNGNLLCHIPEDLRHFKEVTSGAAVIMGRKTWESLPKKPLPKRLNIVISRNPEFTADGAVVVPSLEEAVEAARGHDLFIIGGGEIYARFMPWADRLFITELDAVFENADTFFPEIDKASWKIVGSSPWAVADNGVKYRFVDYVRR